MVVDDSSIVRGFLTRFLESDPEIKVTAAVPNGQAALQALAAADPEIVILDIEMPVMDGITLLPLLLQARPGLPIVIASTKTRANAALGLKCLALGATDCLGKPTVHDLSEPGAFRDDLVRRVKTLTRRTPAFERAEPRVSPAAPASLPQGATGAYSALAFCSSTGGPAALQKVFETLTAPDVPVFITQHMPAGFTGLLAENLTHATGIDCREAVDGERPEPGRAYIAPGNFHLTVQGRGAARVIALNQDRPEHFCRPAADPMLRSLALSYGASLMAVVLTGMGVDSVAGARAVVAAGGTVLAQDEATSVVWGMPGAVVQAGLSAETLPLAAIGPAVMRRLRGGPA